MTPEEELAELAPEPEVQVWRGGEAGDMHPFSRIAARSMTAASR